MEASMLTKPQRAQPTLGARPYLKHIGIARATTHPILALLLILVLVNFAAKPVQGQTYKVIYNFTSEGDGGGPAGLTLSNSGNFYGVTTNYPGTVFQLKNNGSEWQLNTLYTFKGGDDAAGPLSILVGPGDSLYGASYYGGNPGCGFQCGTVYEVWCSPNFGSGSCTWTEAVLYRFAGDSDGATPGGGAMIFDASGNLYGTTALGGRAEGTVYRLSHSSAGWVKDDIHDMMYEEGAVLWGGVVFDAAGNLYGTAAVGGSVGGPGLGSVYEVTPFASLRSGWKEKTLHSFSDGDDGAFPYGGVIFDRAGNLYGTTAGGDTNEGTVFKMSRSGDQWIFTTLHVFSGPDGANPYSGVVMDNYGNLYGTTIRGGGLAACGTVFKLSQSENGWKHTVLHAFTCGDDGEQPGNLVLHPNGKIYGAAGWGGTRGQGLIFEITP